MSFIGLSRPEEQRLSPMPDVGDAVPHSEQLVATEKCKLIAFLRHVGCPFAEHTIKRLRVWMDEHPEAAVFVVSHGSKEMTDSWLQAVEGHGQLRVVYNQSRSLYGKFGIGFSDSRHFLSPRSLIGVCSLLRKGIHNRDASGTRWQRAAMFLVDDKKVLWSFMGQSAEEFSLPPDSLLR